MSEPERKIFAVEEEAPGAQASRGKFFDSEFILRLGVFSISFFVLGLAAYLSYFWFIYAQTHIETNNAYIEADVFHVQSRMMGFTKQVFVEEDEDVKKDQPLLALDDTDILVEKGFKQAKLKKAKADYERGTLMLKEHGISISDFELLEAALAAATADANGTDLKLKYTKIEAPFEGVIAKSYIKPGQFIQPGQNLFTLISQKRFWIKANYKETQIEKIKIGQAVRISVDAYPDIELAGKVEGIYPSSGSVVSLLPAENSTGNFTKVVQRVSVKISLAAPREIKLRPGMSVTTSIDATASNLSKQFNDAQ